MHPKVKFAFNKYPMYRHFFANVNQAIREGVREIEANDLLTLVTGRGDNVNFLDFAHLTTSLIEASVLYKWVEVRALDTDETLSVASSINMAAPITCGRTVLPNKNVDWTELSGDPSGFAYINVVYRLADLYSED